MPSWLGRCRTRAARGSRRVITLRGSQVDTCQPGISRAAFTQAAIRDGHVRVNGKPQPKTSFAVRAGDVVVCVLPPPPPLEAAPEVRLRARQNKSCGDRSLFLCKLYETLAGCLTECALDGGSVACCCNTRTCKVQASRTARWLGEMPSATSGETPGNPAGGRVRGRAPAGRQQAGRPGGAPVARPRERHARQRAAAPLPPAGHARGAALCWRARICSGVWCAHSPR